MYARDKSTSVICLGYAFDQDEPAIWRPGKPLPPRIIQHVEGGGDVRAWNAGFEWVIWNHTLTRQVDNLPALSLMQLRDTMADAAYWGLPLSLDKATAVLNTPVQKDKAGHALMLRMCKPRSFDPLTGETHWWDEEDPGKLGALCDYCRVDVASERAASQLIPDVPPAERLMWTLDQRINALGVGVDYQLVERLRDLALAGAKDANRRIRDLTGGAVKTITNVKALLPWLKAHGYPGGDLRKDTVAERLDAEGLSDLEREALEIRSEGAKTSAAKLEAMLHASDMRRGTGRVRGMLQYYGAARTGRWAGRLIQLQNMPKGVIADVESAIEHVLDGASLDFIEAFYGPSLAVVSSALRGCIVADPGKMLVVADLSQIEARVIAVLAGQEDNLEVFRSGEDVYVYTAKKIGSDSRQLGKVLVLACGFGMGPDKFRDTAKTYGVHLSVSDADDAVRSWRQVNRGIVGFWYDLERAAKEAVQNPGSITRVRDLKFAMWRGHLLMGLPSGRNLVYRDAQVDEDGDLVYHGVNQYTRRWGELRTYGGKLAENATQAVARDVMRDAIVTSMVDDQLPVVLLVHDEIIAEVPEESAQVAHDRLLEVMRRVPSWLPNLPVDAAGWTGRRYKKA